MHFSIPSAATAILALAPTFASALPLTVRGSDSTSEATCSPNQFGDWSIKNFHYHSSELFTTPAHQNSWGYISFDASNQLFPQTYHCEAASSRLTDFYYGDQEYTCKIASEDDSSVAATADEITFLYSRPSNKLVVKQSWVCNDDEEWPATYRAVGEQALNLTCQDSGVVVNEDWTVDSGEFYSTRTVDCEKIDFEQPVTSLSGVMKA